MQVGLDFDDLVLYLFLSDIDPTVVEMCVNDIKELGGDLGHHQQRIISKGALFLQT